METGSKRRRFDKQFKLDEVRYDNAFTETSFHALKTEMIYWERFETREEAIRKIFEYIEVCYNRQCLHSSPGYLRPVGFEQQYKFNH